MARPVRSASTSRSDRSALMVGYRDDVAHTAEVMRDGFYHTGDVASRDGDGYITYVGRSDDVFKSSDYRISPFELESVLIEHPAVAEAAVVPSPDPLRLCGAQGIHRPRRRPRRRRSDVARSIFEHSRQTSPATSASAGSSSPSCPRRSPERSAASTCAPGRSACASRPERARAENEYWEEDFPDLRSTR